MLLLIGSFIAGMLTVLAPCVLPLLPVVIGGSVSGNTADRRRPLIIAASLAISLFAFTLLLKATTLFINVSPQIFSYISGAILIVLGILTLLPGVYARLIARSGIEHKAQSAIGKGLTNKQAFIGPIIIGAALGPVFSSCSPVYAYILATVLPVSFLQAMVYVVAYIAGLSTLLLLIGFYGQRFISRIRFAANPRGWFQRTIAIIFIIVGLLVATGYDKQFQTWVSTHTPFDFDGISQRFLPESRKTDDSKVFNVQPYAAPEFTGLSDWTNSQPLSMDTLRGKVVLVDFWTYSCINCVRNNPQLIKLYDRYKDDGLVVVGVHAPEFAFERNADNVRKAVKDQGITYPVALDNDFSTWNAFQNRSWPASYLIDADGQVRRVHEGEGQYKQEETAIRQLLEQSGKRLDATRVFNDDMAVPVTAKQSPETYLGSRRASNFTNDKPLAAAPVQTFTPAATLPVNGWTLGGTWQVDEQQIVSRSDALLRFNAAAKDIYLVMGSDQPATVKVLVDGKPVSMQAAGSDVKNGMLQVGEYRLYRLVSFPAFRDGAQLEIQVPAGVRMNAFTFGS